MLKFSAQNIIRQVEVGDAQFLTRLVPLAVVILLISSVYNFMLYRGLDDAQSMDNAQLARQIVRGEGFTTRFLRPAAVVDLGNHAATKALTTGASPQLFPPNQFPAGAPRILPDTYNAPGYPYLLASWFYLVRPQLNQAVSPHLDGFLTPGKSNATPMFSPDRWIPLLNLIFVLLTGVIVYILGRRLFDDRVAWLAVVCYFATNLIWQFSITGLSTSFIIFLVTAALWCALEIFCVSEACFEDEERSFGMAWVWGVLLFLFLTMAFLTRLHLLILIVPVFVLLIAMPRSSWTMATLLVVLATVAVLPWFWHLYKVSGHPLGSNAALFMYGAEGYKDNQIYCATSIPTYERLLRNSSQKEYAGFLWHFENGWRILGANPLILLFVASLLHAYKRRRAQMFQWFLVGTALVIVAANNLGVAEPEALGPWNTLIVLFPAMLVIGSAFFFIQLDRLNLQVWLLNNIIVILFLILTAAPLGIALTTSSNLIYAFPPYMPPLIKVLGSYTQPDEWITTDMPWASAWYADRPSLWLPDSIKDFQSLHDNVCPTGILYFTPVTWAKPASNLMTGEDADWLPFATGQKPPPSFPLGVHTATPPGGPEYNIWSDRPRWQGQ